MKPKRRSSSVVKQDNEDFDSEHDTDRKDSSKRSKLDVKVNPRRKFANMCLDNTEPDEDSDSSASDCSSSLLKRSYSRMIHQSAPPTSMCAMCGQGPYRCLKLHLLHCKSLKEKYQCSLCQTLFFTMQSFKEHQMLLFSCNVCGQVFSDETLFKSHSCPKGSVSPLVLFCSEALPKVCTLCKSFFSSETMLRAHITRAHASIVKTKVCIVGKQPVLNDQNILKEVPNTNVQSTISYSHRATQTNAGMHNVHDASVQSVRTSNFSPSSSDTLPITVIKSEEEPVKIDGQNGPFPANCNSSKTLSTPHTDAMLPTVVPLPDSPSTPLLLVKNNNNKNLVKRINTHWRAKAIYPCQQCGAIFRHLSLMIRHRSLHRGRRPYQCPCGQAFKRQLYLLRHCVQHAEAVSYICASCGDTFTGAKLLAKHMKGRSKKLPSESKARKKVRKRCRMPFMCDCGQLFSRPSAYIWHQIRNRTKKLTS